MQFDFVSLTKSIVEGKRCDFSIKDNKFSVFKDLFFHRIIFEYVDESKPYNYLEFNPETFSVDEKIFHDKVKRLAYEFPYIIKREDDKMVPNNESFFGPVSYVLVKGYEYKEPDLIEIEKLIKKFVIKDYTKLFNIAL